MRIEALETFLHGRDRYDRGDVCLVTDAEGEYFVRNGWARDVDGQVATGDRNASHGQVVEVHASHLGLTSPEV